MGSWSDKSKRREKYGFQNWGWLGLMVGLITYASNYIFAFSGGITNPYYAFVPNIIMAIIYGDSSLVLTGFIYLGIAIGSSVVAGLIYWVYQYLGPREKLIDEPTNKRRGDLYKPDYLKT